MTENVALRALMKTSLIVKARYKSSFVLYDTTIFRAQAIYGYDQTIAQISVDGKCRTIIKSKMLKIKNKFNGGIWKTKTPILFPRHAYAILSITLIKSRAWIKSPTCRHCVMTLLLDFGLVWYQLLPPDRERRLCGAIRSHCHHTEQGFLDCGSLYSNLESLTRNPSSFYKLLNTFFFAQDQVGYLKEALYNFH